MALAPTSRGRPGFLGIRYIRVFNIRYTVFLCRKWGIKYYTFLNFGIKYTALKKSMGSTPFNFREFSQLPGYTEQINLLSRGLKFIPTPVLKENQVRRQLISDFNQFARRMRLQYIYHDKNTEQHPFHVKSSWIPPIQRSVALETYLEEVKIKLAETPLVKPKNGFHSKDIILKKADKGTKTVVMNRGNKINEGLNQPLDKPMVRDTSQRVKHLINALHQAGCIDEMTVKWFNQTPDPPRILVSMDVTSLYTNIPQEEGITIVCNAYENFHAKNPPIATNFLREMLSLILKNSFQFNGKDYLQTHGTAMGTKLAVAFANIFMASIEKEILRQSINKPLTWIRFIDDVFCL